MSRWASSYDPKRQRLVPRRGAVRKGDARRDLRRELRRQHVLNAAEDAFVGVPITEHTVIFKGRSIAIVIAWEIKQRVSAFLRQHRIRTVARGITRDGLYVVTLVCKTEMAKFLLLWDDDEWACVVPRARDGSRLVGSKPPA